MKLRVLLTPAQVSALIDCAEFVKAGEWPFGDRDELRQRAILDRAVAELHRHFDDSPSFPISPSEP